VLTEQALDAAALLWLCHEVALNLIALSRSSSWACWGVSTPSAMTLSSSECASETIVVTIDISCGASVIGSTNEHERNACPGAVPEIEQRDLRLSSVTKM